MTTTSRTTKELIDRENHEKIVTNLFIKKSGPFFGFCIKGGIYKPLGIFVSKIDEDGVADKAGLRIDDEILVVNDEDFTKLKIHEALEFLLHLKSAHMRIRRDSNHNEKRRLTSNKIESSIRAEHKKTDNLFAKIQIARSTLFETFGFTVKSLIENDEFKKLMVTNVLDGSPAHKSLLENGDEVVEVNDRQLRTINDFYDVVHIFRHALILVLLVKKRTKLESAIRPASDEQETKIIESDHVRIELEPELEQAVEQAAAPPPAQPPRSNSSRRRLESIINQLSDDDEEELDSESSKTAPNRLSSDDKRSKSSNIYKTNDSIEAKRRLSKQLKPPSTLKKTTNTYDNIRVVETSSGHRARSTSIQNMLDALRIACLQSGGDEENIEDEEDEIDEDGDEDRSSCSSEEFRQEMLRRAQDWQVPFVASSTFLQAAPPTTTPTAANREESSSSRSTPNVLDSSTTTNTPTSFLATSKYILEAANKVK